VARRTSATSVKEHQAVVEVMTDKATVEIPAPAAGKIARARAKAGDVVPVGSVIFVLETAGAERQDRSTAPAHAAQAAAVAAAVAARGSSPRAPRRTDDKVLAVPSARRVARELGIDLGRSARAPAATAWCAARTSRPSRSRAPRLRQLRRRAAKPATAGRSPLSRSGSPAAAPVLRPGRARDAHPVPRRARKISEAMVRSKFTAPHFTVVEEVDVTELVAARDRRRRFGAEHGVKVTFMPFIMKAVRDRAREVPDAQRAPRRGDAGDRALRLREPRHRDGHRQRPDRAGGQGDAVEGHPAARGRS
jgi:pyruvate dehydrogenase E2 component (dihydrolipoamide acetyltransferase)